MLLGRWRQWLLGRWRGQAGRRLEEGWGVEQTPMCSNPRSGDNYNTEPVSILTIIINLRFLLVAYLMSMLLYSQPPLSLLQSNLEMGSDSQMVVSRMVCWGEGVWVSYKGSSTLELFHTVTQFERSIRLCQFQCTRCSVLADVCDMQ